jgi:PIN domain nuclease of toxin-antitoxin system
VRRAAIDTHALAWYLTAPRRLGRAATRWLRDAEAGKAEIAIPAVVPIELALLREAGRKVVGPAEIQALVSAQPCIGICPLDLEQAREFVLLMSLPEPFDRMIVAAARVRAGPLITADDVIAQSGLVETVWG